MVLLYTVPTHKQLVPLHMQYPGSGSEMSETLAQKLLVFYRYKNSTDISPSRLLVWVGLKYGAGRDCSNGIGMN